jgi:hypothetical protein
MINPWVDLLLWPVLCGVLALVVYKTVSNQKGIDRAKQQIAAHLYEIRLFRHDPLVVLAATARITGRNAIYIGYNLAPMAVLLLPTLFVLTRLEANYAFGPTPEGDVELFHLEMDPSSAVAPRDVKLALPPGVALDAPAVRTPDGDVFWRLRAETPGDHALEIAAGGDRLPIVWSVGGDVRKVAPKYTKTWERFLYPGAPAVAASSPFQTLSIPYPERDLSPFPSGEFGILASFFVLSLVAGFALKGVFGVTL